MPEEERNLSLDEYWEVSPLRDGFEGTFSRIAHEHRYRWLATMGRSLGLALEVGGGLGFAVPVLRSVCRELVEVDFNAAVLRRAAVANPGAASFVVADCLAAPFGDASFDSIVAFEIIEHLEQPRRFAAELCRLLRPGGTAFLSTPNREERERKGRAMFELHAREYSAAELRDVLSEVFDRVEILGQRYCNPAVRRVQSRPGLRRLAQRIQRALPASWRERLLRKLFPPSAIWAGWRIDADDVEHSDTLLAVCTRSR